MQQYKGPWAACITTIEEGDLDDMILPKLLYAMRRENVAESDVLYLKLYDYASNAHHYLAISRQAVLMPPIEPWTPKQEEEK